MFDVTIDTEALVASVHVHGELDIDTVPILRATFDALLAAGSTRIVVDAADLTFLDSTGISCLIAAYQRAGETGGWLCVEGVRGMPLRALEITGLERLLCGPRPARDSAPTSHRPTSPQEPPPRT